VRACRDRAVLMCLCVCHLSEKDPSIGWPKVFTDFVLNVNNL